MTDDTVLGTYAYGTAARALVLLALVLPLVYASSVSVGVVYLGEGVGLMWGSWAVALLIAAFVVPTAVTFLTGTLFIEDSRIRWTSMVSEKSMALDDVIDVRLRSSGGALESLYVEDSAGTRIAIDGALDRFATVKEFLLPIAELNGRRLDDELGRGVHGYRRKYKLVVLLVVAALWVGVFFGNVPLLIPAILGLMVAADALTFYVIVEEDGLRASSWRWAREILFHDISEIVVTTAPFEVCTVRATDGRKVSFYGFLERYAPVKRHIVREHRATQVHRVDID